jgi:hypothetical protein
MVGIRFGQSRADNPRVAAQEFINQSRDRMYPMSCSSAGTDTA